MTSRKKPAIRREEILTAALQLAESKGYNTVSRDDIARKLGVSGPTVQYHIGTMANLRRDIVRAAIKQENLVVLGQALVLRDKHAAKAPDDLKRAAVEGVL